MVHRASATLATMILWAGFLATGCSTPAWTSPPGSERYQIGYRDGCDAGYAIGGSFFYERIDSAEPAHDDVDYVNGWKYGFLNCKKKGDHFQATLHSILGASFP